MKDVLISIRPQWVEKIANGEKTIEVRKTKPKLETPFKCFIYCTAPSKKTQYMIGKLCCKMVGEFICDWIEKIKPHYDIESFVNQYIHEPPTFRDIENFTDQYIHERSPILGGNDCLSFPEMKDYLGGNIGYGWHISDLKIYDKPKELSEFVTFCNKHYGDDCIGCDVVKGKDYVYIGKDCEDKGLKPLTRPPQSWCYVEGE